MRWRTLFIGVIIFTVLFASILSFSIYIIKYAGIQITDAKMAQGVDERLMPVRITNTFAKDTRAVTCWFQWKGAKVGNQLTARWRFVTDDIQVYDYKFTLPRKAGAGSISLSMPNGKTLPSGKYRLDIVFNGHRLKSIIFTVG